MPRPYTQIRLSTACFDDLTKHCICVTGRKNTRRCRGVRASEYGQQESQDTKERHRELVRSLLLHYVDLTDEDRNCYAEELAALSVCRGCQSKGKIEEVKEELLRQRAEEEGWTPNGIAETIEAGAVRGDGPFPALQPSPNVQIPMHHDPPHQQTGAIQPPTQSIIHRLTPFESTNLRHSGPPVDQHERMNLWKTISRAIAGTKWSSRGQKVSRARLHRLEKQARLIARMIGLPRDRQSRSRHSDSRYAMLEYWMQKERPDIAT